MNTMEQTTKEVLKGIETLNQELADLQNKKAEVIKEIDAPIYWAKKEAEKIIADAKNQAQAITEEAAAKKAADEEDIGKKKQELKVLLDAAQRRNDDVLGARKALDKEKVDFDAAKYALETNLKQQKMDEDRTMSEAIKLQGELNTLRVNLDSRQSIIQKKEEDYQLNIVKLGQAKAEAQVKIDELATREKSQADDKIEIAAIKARNDQILAGIVAERNKINEDIIKNQNVLNETKTALDSIVKKNEENTRLLKLLDKTNAELTEREKSLNEKERLQKILSRQIDEKISTLNLLREDDKR